jgi:hypothetical protein
VVAVSAKTGGNSCFGPLKSRYENGGFLAVLLPHHHLCCTKKNADGLRPFLALHCGSGLRHFAFYTKQFL